MDHCYALDLIYHQAQPGEHYNIGADHELSNIKLTQTICQLLDKIKPRSSGQSYQQLITFVDDRPGHDLRYAIDASKIKKDLNWQKSIDFNSGLRDSIEWYLNINIRPHHC